MKRWGFSFAELRMKNLPAYKQVDFIHLPYGYEYSPLIALTERDPVTGQRRLKDLRTEFTGKDIGEFIPKTKEDFEEAFYKIEDIEEFENKNPEILNEPFLQKKNITIPIPKGTTWDQIKIRIVNKGHIEIKIPGTKNSVPYSDRDIGLASKRILWPLFEQLAKAKGNLIPKDYSSLKPNISNLRKHLKAIFPEIPGSPIRNYDPTNGYVCNFRITDSSTR